jgi:2-polyprenyl-3-methyl-5-hydroxy-6-metoxy-1,4-benzoquinol methylase
MPALTRQLVPEQLDQLPATDPAAIHSRRDLRRINWFMRNAALIARACRHAWRGAPPSRLVDLGAGDGALLTALENRLGRHWPQVTVTLVDRAEIAAPSATGRWRVERVCADATKWLARQGPGTLDVVIANLFLHHFTETELQPLLAGCARVARLFVTCEPRRSRRALAACRLLGVLGCNHVTRHDARASVRAGFAGRELSALWPDSGRWELQERAAGPFSHLFVAYRRT